MALRTLPYIPTVIKDDSAYAAEGAAVDSDKIRWVRGKAESQKGFQQKYEETVSGVPRSIQVWADEDARVYQAYGSSAGLYIVLSNRMWDITPESKTGTFASSSYASVTSGSSDVVLTFSGIEHGLVDGDKILLWNTTSVGGVEFGGYSSGLTLIGTTEGQYSATMTVSGHGLSNGDFVAIPSSASVTVGGYVFNGTTGSVPTSGVSTVSGSTAVKLTVSNHDHYVGDLVTYSGVATVGGVDINGLRYVEYVDDANNYYVEADSAATSTTSGGGASGTYDSSRVFRVRTLDANRLLVYIDTVATATDSGGAAEPIFTARSYAVTTSGSSQLVITGSGTATSTTSGGGTGANYQLPLGGGRVNTTGTGFGTGGYGVGNYGSYSGSANLNLLDARLWNLRNYGTFLVASPRFGKIYVWPLNPSRRAGWLTNAPEENYSIAVSKERVLLAGGCTNTDGFFDPLLVRNSDILLINTWIPDFDNNAGDFRIGGQNSEIVQMRNLENGILLWTDNGFFIGNYTGVQEQLFRFTEAGANCGLISPFGFIEQDGQAFWITPQIQFFTFAGGRPRSIPCPNRDWFEENLDRSQSIKLFGVLDPIYGAATWHFPAVTTAGTAEVDTYLRYDFREAQSNILYGWSVGTYERTAWTPGTLLANDIATTSGGVVYDHGVGNSADGAALTKFVRFAPIDLSSPEGGDGTFKMNMSRVVMGSKLGDSTTLRLYFYLRDWPNAPETTKGPYTYTSGTDRLDIRLSARQIGFEVQSIGTNDDWRLGNIRGDITMGPRR